MRKFRLLVVFALCISLISGSLCGFAANATTDATATEPEKVVVDSEERDFLEKLGFVPYKAEILDDKVNNKEFASALAMVGGYIDEYYNNDALESMVNSGIMLSGNSNPTKTVRYDQAIKAIVSVLGYDYLAKENSGYPNGYRVVANKIGITTGISLSYTAEMTYRDLCKLLYNALHTDCSVQEVYGDVQKYTKYKDLLYVKSNIKHELVRVTGNEFTTMSNPNEYNEGKIEIDGHMYDAKHDFNSFIGMNVECYYDEDEKIVYYMRDKNDSVVTAKSEDIISTANDTVTVYNNNKKKNYKMSDGYVVVYNNRISERSLGDIINYENEVTGTTGINGYVEIINTDGKGLNLLRVYDYNTFEVGSVSADARQVFDKYNSANYIDFSDECDSAIIKDATGATLTVAGIKEGSVVSGLVSEDKKVVNITVSDTELEGTVNSIREGSYKNVVTVDGTEYTIGKTFTNPEAYIESGKLYVLKLDIYGEVYGAEEQTIEYNVGVPVALSVDTVIDTTIKIQIYKVTGEVAVEELSSSNVNIDGISYKKADNVITALRNEDGSMKYGLIRYTLNKEGKINKIDTPNKTEEEDGAATLEKTYGYEDAYKGLSYLNQSNFEGLGLTHSGTKFVGCIYDDAASGTVKEKIAKDRTNIDNYYPLTTSYFGYFIDGFQHAVDLYTVEESGTLVDVVVAYIPKSINGGFNNLYKKGTTIYVTDTNVKQIDKNGDIVNAISGINLKTNSEVTIPYKTDSYYYNSGTETTKISAIKTGDIITYHKTVDGYMNQVERIINVKEPNNWLGKKINGKLCTTESRTSSRYMLGIPYSIYDSKNMKLVYLSDFNGNVTDEDLKDVANWCVNGDLKSIFKYSPDAKDVKSALTKIDASDIKTYLRSNNNCNKVFVISVLASVEVCIVFD